MFNDAGWQHLGQMGGWQYFCRLAGEGELPEIYSDPDSKTQKYRRLLAYLMIFLPISIIFFSRGSESPGYPIIQVVYTVLMVVYIFAVVNILGCIGKLKHL